MPIFQKCCCLSLRTVNLIIGWIGLVFFISLGFTFSVYINFMLQGISLIGCVMHILLIYGIVKSSKLMLIPWLVTVLFTILFLLTIVINLIIDLVEYEDIPVVGLIHLIIISLVSGLLTIMWLFALSFYQYINDEEMLDLQHLNAGIPLQVFSSSFSESESSSPKYNELVNTNNTA